MFLERVHKTASLLFHHFRAISDMGCPRSLLWIMHHLFAEQKYYLFIKALSGAFLRTHHG